MRISVGLSGVFFFLMSLGLHAQTPDYRDTTSMEFPSYRNEVFLNVSPLAVLLLAGESIKPRWSIGFQRHIKPNLTGRIWANYQVHEDLFEDKSDGKVVPVGANTFELRTRDHFDYSIDLRAGVTFSKPDQRISAVYGADVFGGMRSRNFKDLTDTFVLDSALCSNCYVPSPLIAAKTMNSEEKYLLFGVDFSVGCLFRASDRVWLNLQWIPQLSYSSLIDEQFSDPENRGAEIEGLNFNISGIELFTSIRF